jgi:hydrogenase nickel incorporation protein HypA/HybF
MHEYSIALALLERAEDEARQRRATAVERVRVRIGELSGVVPELFVTAFEISRSESELCKNAALEVDYVPCSWACSKCSKPIESGEKLECSICGAPARLAAGDEMLLASLELEVPDV